MILNLYLSNTKYFERGSKNKLSPEVGDIVLYRAPGRAPSLATIDEKLSTKIVGIRKTDNHLSSKKLNKYDLYVNRKVSVSVNTLSLIYREKTPNNLNVKSHK